MKFLVLCRAVSDDEVTMGIPPVSPASLGTLCVCFLKPNQAQRPSKHQRRAGSPAEGFSLFLSLSTYSLCKAPCQPTFGRTCRGLPGLGRFRKLEECEKGESL